MDEHFHRIGGNARGGCGNVSSAVRQIPGGREWVGLAADGKVGNSAADVPVPGAGAYVARGRDIDQLIIGCAIGKCGDTRRRALAGLGRWSGSLLRLAKGERDSPGRRRHLDRLHVREP